MNVWATTGIIYGSFLVVQNRVVQFCTTFVFRLVVNEKIIGKGGKE